MNLSKNLGQTFNSAAKCKIIKWTFSWYLFPKFLPVRFVFVLHRNQKVTIIRISIYIHQLFYASLILSLIETRKWQSLQFQQRRFLCTFTPAFNLSDLCIQDTPESNITARLFNYLDNIFTENLWIATCKSKILWKFPLQWLKCLKSGPSSLAQTSSYLLNTTRKIDQIRCPNDFLKLDNLRSFPESRLQLFS